MLSIGWFSTGRGEGSLGLLKFVQERILDGRLDANIQFVFSNREAGEAEGSDRYFGLVESYGLPLVTASSVKFRRARGGRFAEHREEYDRRVMELLSAYDPEVCVLAGYMLIAGAAMCRDYSLLNLHPALPDGPIGAWQDVIWRLIETEASQTGAMMHLATEEVDRGPVVSHCTTPITGSAFAPLWEEVRRSGLPLLRAQQGEELALFQLIRRAEYRKEPYLLSETLRCLAEGRLTLAQGQAWDPGGSLLSESHPWGLCLDEEVAAGMAADEAAG
jgi:folate-dependent phosphoribosylglycinamide formyltransferase PurN